MSTVREALTELKIFRRHDCFFVFVLDEIAIVKKKFGKYIIIDSIADKIKN